MFSERVCHVVLGGANIKCKGKISGLFYATMIGVAALLIPILSWYFPIPKVIALTNSSLAMVALELFSSLSRSIVMWSFKMKQHSFYLVL